jgi:DNA-binding IscR family transcriptional regulator
MRGGFLASMISTRFAVSLHILLSIARSPSGRATSIETARSVGTNPVVIRRLTSYLRQAGLVRVTRHAGAELAHPASAITLAQVWAAVQGKERMLPVHRGPSKPIALAMVAPRLLRGVFDRAEEVLMQHLGTLTLDQLVQESATAEAAERQT